MINKIKFLLLFILCFTLYNCEKAVNENSKKNQEQQIIELLFWHGMEGRFKNDLLAKKITEFNNSNKTIHVTLHNFGASDRLGAKIMTAVAGNKLPDLLWWAPQQFGVLADSDLLLELDTAISQDLSFNSNDIYPALWEASKINGKTYSIPFETNNLAIYYNKKMFEDAGIKQLPDNWDNFALVAEKLTMDKNNDGKTDIYGFQIPLGKNEWTVWVWQTFLWQAGGEFYDIAKKKPLFSGTEGIEALDYWGKLLNAGSAIFSEAEAGYKIGDFLAGRVAMIINGPWNFHELKSQKHIGSFPLPRYKRAATNIGGEHIAVFKSNNKKQEAAWKFLRFLTSSDFQVEWSINTGYLPVSISASNSKKYKKYLNENPFMKTFSKQMRFGMSRPSITEYNKISAAVGEAIEKVLYGKTDSKTALESAAGKCCK